ncbi:hypothetical protein EJA70_08420 [Pseudomonas sp. PB103]|nr:hypothetical protein EJA70_08420 [Pseudomonas sp. PB103]
MQLVDLQHVQIPSLATEPCGSWLASDSGGSVGINVGCAGLIAGKPAPTGFVFANLSDRGKPRSRARFPALAQASLPPARCPGAAR